MSEGAGGFNFNQWYAATQAGQGGGGEGDAARLWPQAIGGLIGINPDFTTGLLPDHNVGSGLSLTSAAPLGRGAPGGMLARFLTLFVRDHTYLLGDDMNGIGGDMGGGDIAMGDMGSFDSGGGGGGDFSGGDMGGMSGSDFAVGAISMPGGGDDFIQYGGIQIPTSIASDAQASNMVDMSFSALGSLTPNVGGGMRESGIEIG